ncbi:MAG TPA: XRE family transcriptional regulator [Solirubrobacteraceae bacterium]|jgi:transcriptional regulator with XRE-family HTH domain|nr:XRE family transcriptional regulator [Solirubrobacteraceae bacterium]
MSTEEMNLEAGGRWSPTRIGELVAQYRHARNLKVSQLAREVGVTPSLISQIERGNSRPSVPTLFALAEALDVSVDVFAGRDVLASESGLATRPADTAGVTAAVASVARMTGASAPPPEDEQRYFVRNKDRRSIAIAGGVTWEMLTPSRRGDVEFLELVYQPHAESNAVLYRHPGFEMVLVLVGRFEIYVGFDVYELSEGDSIAFPSSLPHRYVNPTDGESHAVTVIVRDTVAAASMQSAPGLVEQPAAL